MRDGIIDGTDLDQKLRDLENEPDIVNFLQYAHTLSTIEGTAEIAFYDFTKRQHSTLGNFVELSSLNDWQKKDLIASPYSMQYLIARSIRIIAPEQFGDVYYKSKELSPDEQL